ncbi:MAG: ATPase domain-containing protein [Myxococcales bacterium]
MTNTYCAAESFRASAPDNDCRVLSLAEHDAPQLSADELVFSKERESAVLDAYRAACAVDSVSPEERAKETIVTWSKPDGVRFSLAVEHYFDTLEGFNPYGGECILRAEPTELTWAQNAAAYNAGVHYDLSRVRCEPQARRWCVIADTMTIVPANVVTDIERNAYAKKYRASVDSLRDREMHVFAVAGQPVHLALWSDVPLTDAQVKDACSRLAPGDRFEPVEYPWLVPGDIEVPVLGPHRVDSEGDAMPRKVLRTDYYSPQVYLKPVHKPATAFALASQSVGTTSAQGFKTGMPALDRQFRGIACLPRGARLCISGGAKNCKTLAMLELAESALAQGAFVVWIAVDEPAESIVTRRLQRLGLTPAQAMTDGPARLAGLATLDAQAFHAVGGCIEDLCKLASEETTGPILVAVDSLQTVRTRAGEGKGDRERIEAALETMKAMQMAYPSITFVYTSEVTRGTGEAKGSIGIEYASTVHLQVKKAGDSLAVAVKANRHGTAEPFTLAVDLDGQRLADLAAVKAATKVSDGMTAVWSEVRKTLTEHGPAMSRSAIETWVKVKSSTLRKALTEGVAAGVLVMIDDTYRLADSAT